jgi:hypothetical protein
MMFFRVIPAVRHEAANRDPADRFLHGRQKARRVVAWPATNQCRQNEMAAMIDDRRKLGPPTVRGAAARSCSAIEEVTADIMIFQSRGIDTGFARGGEQLELAGLTNHFS